MKKIAFLKCNLIDYCAVLKFELGQFLLFLAHYGISCRHESVGSSIKRIVGFVFLHPCELYRMMDFYRTTLCPTMYVVFKKNSRPIH